MLLYMVVAHKHTKLRAEILLDSGVGNNTEIQPGTSMLNCVANEVGLSMPSSVQSKSCVNCNEKKKKQFFNTTVILESGKNYDLKKLNHLF